MSTSTVVHPESDQACPGDLLARIELPWSHRRIAQAILLSLILHAALLLAVRFSGPESDALSLFPELVLQIEFEEGQAPERDDPPPPPATQPETPARPTEQLVAARAEPSRATDVEAIPLGDEPLPVLSQEGPAEAVVLQESSATPLEQSDSALNLLTTTGPSEQSVPTQTTPERQEARYVAIPTPEQEALSQRVLQGVRTLEATDAPQLRLSWQEGERQYVAVLTRQPAVDGMSIERVTVEIESEEHGKKLRTRAQMKRLAFSHFTQLVDRWDRDVQLHDDVISGRFHSNSEIVLAYDRKVAPLFLGKVTTAARTFSFGENIGRRRRDDIFPHGIETRARKIEFPEKLIPAALQQAGNAHVHSVADDARITFYSDGTYGVFLEDSEAREDRRLDPETPTYIVGAPGSTLHVRGIVRGKVLVYSPLKIVIEDDLTYARDPRSAGASDDYLGLVSDRYVEIASPEHTGPGDLHIQAAVYAKRRFDVTHTQSRRAGTLYIYGSLTAGTLSETEPRYATTIEFDPRFERLRPPGFPQTNHYEIESWDPRWEEVERTGES